MLSSRLSQTQRTQDEEIRVLQSNVVTDMATVEQYQHNGYDKPLRPVFLIFTNLLRQ